MRYALVVNAQGGSAARKGWSEETVAVLFRRNGLDAVTMPGDSLKARLRAAREAPVDAVVVGGGDGSVACAAEVLAGSGKPLAILPLGTANLVARDLGILLDPEAAVAQLAAWRPRRIDLGEVNGRVFLSKVMLGLSPVLAEARRRKRRRGARELLGRLTHIGGFLAAVGRFRQLEIEIDWGEGPAALATSALAIGNNVYDEGFGRVFARSRLDDGLLTVYAAKRLTPWRVAKLLFRMAIGRWRSLPELLVRQAREVTITSGRHLHHMTVDGEVAKARPPLRFRILPGALTVLAPPERE
jgi:diacylglycerol kinase family enzyme